MCHRDKKDRPGPQSRREAILVTHSNVWHARGTSRGTAGLLAALAIACAPAPTRAADAGFETWLAELREEAIERGLQPATVMAALGNVTLVDEVVRLDGQQPHKARDFCGYMKRRLTPTRIERARRVMISHADLLNEITAEYGVPARYLVALWGLETNYGDYVGTFPVIDSLVTLAHNPRRSEMFRAQVFDALRILEEGHVQPADFVGSWAGATGQLQFMPSTFLAFAVDHDGDGRKDIWANEADALATAANYLRKSGWRGGETWGRQVTLPANLAAGEAALGARSPLVEWQARGVRRIGGGDLPLSDLRGSIVRPRRATDPSFLVYRNYRAFLAWNRSTFFAISVGTLADAVTGAASLQACDS
ncbi:MAG: lytic transglycosylase domain-containing protein [Myxococcota bacterium]